jgi:CubicO group peptidase (beta-lactamase class C family)
LPASNEIPLLPSDHLIALYRFVLTIAICSGAASAESYEYAVPEKITGSWETASLEGEKIDAGQVASMFEQISTGEFKNISSVLLVRNGKLVAEEYFPRVEGDRRAQAFPRVAPREITSATKSITSILIGIAIDKRLIRGVNEKVSALLPTYADQFAGRDKYGLRLRHLLTMCAGLSWDEWSYPYSDPRNSHIQMLRASDPIRYVFEQKLVETPGAHFAYSSGISLALGEIIHNVAKMPVDKFAAQNLFEPLGITDFYWSKYPGEIVQTGGGLFLRPRDMAKIGYLFLNEGRWQGKQIVSADWVKESTSNQVPAGQMPAAARADGYGYQWWLSSFDHEGQSIASYSARGRGGQFILVAPSLQLVAVFTSPPENELTFQPLDLMQRYILPAVMDKKGESAPPTAAK